ncbi:hypothetical protein [Streptomyces sp. NPDC091268]|uniref:hypothetical protein n=1 Tax=Streptomyces sp. NPDC091268 TaxID=3365979 RepID=UPI0037FE747A
MAQRKGCLIGCGMALVLGVGALVLLVFAVGKMKDVADESLLDSGVYQSVTVGEAEEAVRTRLPSGETFVKGALKEGGPAEPVGSTCSWYASSGSGKDAAETVFRFCYKDGKLAEKVEYRMK